MSVQPWYIQYLNQILGALGCITLTIYVYPILTRKVNKDYYKLRKNKASVLGIVSVILIFLILPIVPVQVTIDNRTVNQAESITTYIINALYR